MGTIKLQNCNWCKLSKTRTQVVQGAGSLDSQLLFLAEAPGRYEDASGCPFSAKVSSEIYDSILDALDLTREQVWTTHACKCWPTEMVHDRYRNRPPDFDEIEACSEWLNLEIDEIKPKIIVVMGSTALFRISKLTGIFHHRGRFISIPGKQYLVFPIFHPSHISYNRKRDEFIDVLKDDLENLKKGIDKCLKRKGQ